MNLPSIERALIGLWIAEEALTTFQLEYDAEVGTSPEVRTDDERQQHMDKLRELVGLEDDDAFAWAYQLRQQLAILESITYPPRIELARTVKEKIAAQLATDRG
jgi:hypothetical protein